MHQLHKENNFVLKHETFSDKYSKEEFVAGFGMPGRYYSFDKGDFHFIVLDGNNLFDEGKYIPYQYFGKFLPKN